MPRIECPNGHALSVPPEMHGKKGKCPKCRVTFVVEIPELAAKEPELAEELPDSIEDEFVIDEEFAWRDVDDLEDEQPSSPANVGRRPSGARGSEKPPDKSTAKRAAASGSSVGQRVPRIWLAAAIPPVLLITCALVYWFSRGRPAPEPKTSNVTAASVSEEHEQSSAAADQAVAAKPPVDNAAPTPVATPQQSSPASSGSDLVEVRRAVDGAIAALEARDLRRFYLEYAPVEQLRRFRDRNEKTDYGRDPEGPLLRLLKPYVGGEVRFESEGMTAAISPAPAEFASSPASPASKASSDPKQDGLKLEGYGGDLPAMLKASVAALEKGEIEAFIQHVFPAGELGRLKQEKGMARLVALIKSRPEMPAQMIRDLKACQTEKPEAGDDASTTTFLIEGTPGDQRPDRPREPTVRVVKFQKVGGSWRFYDKATFVRSEIVRQSSLDPPSLLYPETGSAGTRRDERGLMMEKIGAGWRISRMPGLGY